MLSSRAGTGLGGLFLVTVILLAAQLVSGAIALAI